MPKSKIRRMFWFINNSLWVFVAIAGGVAAIFGEDPWKALIVSGAFGAIATKTLMDFSAKLTRGPRPHLSILFKDYR